MTARTMTPMTTMTYQAARPASTNLALGACALIVRQEHSNRSQDLVAALAKTALLDHILRRKGRQRVHLALRELLPQTQAKLYAQRASQENIQSEQATQGALFAALESTIRAPEQRLRQRVRTALLTRFRAR